MLGIFLVVGTYGGRERSPFREACVGTGCGHIPNLSLVRVDSMRQECYEIGHLRKERPVGIQIFGAVLESMRKCVEIVEASCPDIIDINFGCPVKKVVPKVQGPVF